jgi:NAD(P)-dependent dehydrogenase (short-subunit alcohol dehydrogenase family)
MPRYELDGQVAIVTGAGRGIGRAIARRLAHEGASVAVSDLDVENAAGVADEITAAGGKAISLRTDVSRKAEEK